MALATSRSVITAVKKHEDGERGGTARDRLILDADHRASPHFSAFTELGVKVHVSLERGSELEERDVLVAPDGYAIEIVPADEDLLVVKPGPTTLEWAAVCYQLGNLHRPLKVLDEEILTPRDAQAEAFLTKLGVIYRREQRPFVGQKLGTAAAHHHHGHHGHDH